MDKVFEEVVILKGIILEVYWGEFVVIVGVVGSGKSFFFLVFFGEMEVYMWEF